MYDCVEKLKRTWSFGWKLDAYEGSHKEAIVWRARGVVQKGQFSRVVSQSRGKVNR